MWYNCSYSYSGELWFCVFVPSRLTASNESSAEALGRFFFDVKSSSSEPTNAFDLYDVLPLSCVGCDMELSDIEMRAACELLVC